MKSKTKPKDSRKEGRDRILDAAETVVTRNGVGRLTLDSAAAVAGLSKGGILYHFPTKQALLAGLVERLVNACEQKHLAAGNSLGTSPGRWTKAFLIASTEGQRDPEKHFAKVSSAMLAAMAHDPELLSPLRELYQTWQARLENDGIAPAVSTLVRFAMDGIWMAEIFGLPVPSRPVQDQLLRELENLLKFAVQNSSTAIATAPQPE